MKHPERFRIYAQRSRANNRESNLLLSIRKRMRKRALPMSFTIQDMQFCRQYFHYACAACGREEGFQWTIAMDHWVPLSSPNCPGTLPTNMIPLCDGIGSCNGSKNNKPAKQWLLERFGPRKAAQILKKIATYFEIVRARQSVA